MENKACLSTIRTQYSHLTKKEKLLADYILAHYEEIPSMPTSCLAEQAGVVKSVIVRLCQSLGFDGYTEFKLSLSRELVRNEQFHFTPYIEKNDKTADIFDKVFAANVKTLHDTAAVIDRKQIDRIVDVLSAAKHIYIYGVGTSAGIVCDFQYRLMQLGFTAFCFTDIVNMKVSALNITKEDVAVGISNSGRTVATVDSLNFAHDKGAKTICLTSYQNSEITKKSDFSIVIKTDEIQYPIEAISARIAHISVLDSIAIALSARNYENALERSAKTKNVIDSVRY